MRCDGFDPENYGLYSSGSLDGAEATAIDQHLAGGCEVCLREVRRGIAFWGGFGAALSPDGGEPQSRLWSNLPAPISSRKPSNFLAWPQWGALAALLVSILGMTFWFVSTREAAERRHAAAEMARLRVHTQQLSHERDQALASAQKRAAAPQLSTSPAKTSSGPRAKEFAQLEQALSEVRRESQEAQQSLVTARTNAAKLQDQLDQQQTELAAARSQRAQLSAQVTADTARQQDALGRVQTLESRVAQLQTERARLLNLVQTRQRQSEQTLRTISFLSTPGTKLVELHGTQSAPSSRGYALLSRDGRLIFYQAGLPSPPSGRIYQIWLIRDKGEPVVSGGLFTAESRGATQSEFSEGNLIAGLRAVAVTEEPIGGSKLPTGHKLLLGTVRS